MAEERILDRVRKLLQLAQSDNVNEAASAAAQAQALMSRHAIREAMLTTVTAEEEIETGLLNANGSKHLATWRAFLAGAVCDVNNATYYTRGSDIHIVGRPSDADKARFMFVHIATQVDRLCEGAASLRGAPGRTWCNNFRLGAVDSVDKRLRDAHKDTIAAMRREADASDTMGTGVALVRVNTAIVKLDAVKTEVDEKLKSMKPRKASQKRYRTNQDGLREGARAGSTIDVAPATGGALGGGQKRQLRG